MQAVGIIPGMNRTERTIGDRTFTVIHRPDRLPQARWQARLGDISEYSVTEDTAIARLIVFLATGRHTHHAVTLDEALALS